MTKFAIALASAAAAVAISSSAEAEPIRPLTADVAAEFHVGDGVITTGGRIYVGYAHSLAQLSPRWKLYGSVGGHAHFGQAVVDDIRAVNGTVTVGRSLLGPEARIGFAYGRRWPTLTTYLAASAYKVDAETISTELAEAGGAYGYRAAVGFQWTGSWRAYAEKLDEDDDDQGGALMALAFLMPNSLELSMERVSRDAPRLGGGLAWAF